MKLDGRLDSVMSSVASPAGPDLVCVCAGDLVRVRVIDVGREMGAGTDITVSKHKKQNCRIVPYLRSPSIDLTCQLVRLRGPWESK